MNYQGDYMLSKVMQKASEKLIKSGGEPYGIVCSREKAMELLSWAMFYGYKVATSGDCPLDRIYVVSKQDFERLQKERRFRP